MESLLIFLLIFLIILIIRLKFRIKKKMNDKNIELNTFNAISIYFIVALPLTVDCCPKEKKVINFISLSILILTIIIVIVVKSKYA